MNIRLSLALALVSSLSVFACSGGEEIDAPAPSASEPASAEAPPAPSSPEQGRTRHRLAPSSHLSGAPSFAAMRTLDADGGTQGPTEISTDKTTYAYCEPIEVTFENMPGNANDWIDFAPAGSDNTVFSWDAYTNSLGPSNSTTTLPGDCLPPGTYVARAFPSDTYNRIAQSATFTVGAKPTTPTATIALDKTAMDGFGKVTATITNAAPSTSVWVTASKPHQSTNTRYFGKYAQTDASGKATVEIGNVVAGVLEVRVFEENDWTGTSAQTVTVTPAVKATYSGGANVLVEYGGMQALDTHDRVVLAKWNGSAFQTFAQIEADWWWSGSKSFSGLTSGEYVAQVFFAYHGTPGTPDAQSAQFTVTVP